MSSQRPARTRRVCNSRVGVILQLVASPYNMDIYGSARPRPYSPARPCASGFSQTASTTRVTPSFNAPLERSKTGSGRRTSPGPFQSSRRGELTRMPALTPAAPVAMCQMITPEDWVRANAANYRRSESNRRHAEHFREETSRLIQSEEQLTRRTQAESSRWIGQRIADISFWRSELAFELEQLLRDTDALRGVKMRLDRALAETEGPLHMARECLYQRQKRMGNDRVSDAVEKDLVQEVAVISSCQERLERIRDQVKTQLESNRRAQHHLEKDMNDKHVALQIDGHCLALSNASTHTSYYPDLSMDTSACAPALWARYSEDNIERAALERRSSREARETVERALAAMATEMWSQYSRVNAAFAERIGQTLHAKNTLLQHLAKTLQEMQQTERTISELEGSIREKRGPLRVAQTRLEERTHRPNMELCKDPAHTSLQAEVGGLQAAVASLRRRLSDARLTLGGLAGGRARLEAELFTKAHALHVDRDVCLGLRRVYPSAPRLAGHA